MIPSPGYNIKPHYGESTYTCPAPECDWESRNGENYRKHYAETHLSPRERLIHEVEEMILDQDWKSGEQDYSYGEEGTWYNPDLSDYNVHPVATQIVEKLLGPTEE